MTRPIRYLVVAAMLMGIAWVSFAGGQKLRRVSAGSIVHVDTRLSALPEAGFTGDFGQSTGRTDNDDPSAVFQQVVDYVKDQYVDRVTDDKKLGFGAVRTMVMSLDDPKTRFYDPTQLAALRGQMDGRFSGIGAIVTAVKQKLNGIDENRLTVVATVPDGPADKAGVRPGDIITEIDGHWVIAYDPLLDLGREKVQDMDNEAYKQAQKAAATRLLSGISLPKALDELNGKDGKPVTLTIERSGTAAPTKIQVTRGPAELTPVEFKPVNDHVAYLRVTQFSDRATQAFTQALQGARQDALVLDLRNNASGPVTAVAAGPMGSAKALVSLLAGGGPMGDIVRKGNRVEPIVAPQGSARRTKLVVLVNTGTSNLAEIVAATLKQRAGARLVGEHTFGDSTFQKLVDLRNGAAMTIRAGKLLAPGNVDFAGKGIQPDVAMATGGPRSTGDPALDRAVGVLGGA